MGRVTRLAVEEGQRVKAGQFLLEIDPRQLEGQLQRGRGQRRRGAVRPGAGTGQRNGRRDASSSRRPAFNCRSRISSVSRTSGRTGSPRAKSLERAQNEVTMRESDVKRSQQDITARQQEIETREQQIKQEQAGLSTTRYNLTQIVIESPMDGIVTRRNIEEGETAVVGTMNNAGTVLLTIADMSVIEAEVEVDETDIPTVALGQPPRSRSTRLQTGRSAARDRDRQQPDSGEQSAGRAAPGDDVQGRDHAGRGDARTCVRASPAPPKSRRRRSRASPRCRSRR